MHSQLSKILYSCILGALAFLLSIPVGKAETPAPGTRLHVLCPPKEKEVATVCDEYLEVHYSDKYDSLRQLLDSIDKRKDQVRDWAQFDKYWLLGSKWTIVILGTIASIMIALDKLRNIDLRRWAIVPTALTAAVTAIASFYDFGQSHRDNIEAQTRYAFLLQELSYDLIEAVEKGKPLLVDRAFITYYQDALHKAVEARTADYFIHLSERASRGGEHPTLLPHRH